MCTYDVANDLRIMNSKNQSDLAGEIQVAGLNS